MKKGFIATEYKGMYLQTFEQTDSFVTYSFSDPNYSIPIKAMSASGKHEGAQVSIDKSKVKIDNLLNP